MIAGLIAATPANQAVTHMVITRYVDLVEPLTNTQIIKAELKGCLVLSKSTEDEVWIDAGQDMSYCTEQMPSPTL